MVAGTLAAAIVGGLASNSAFDARYASVVFIPLILLVALGLTVFRDRHVRVGILAVAMVGSASAARSPTSTTNRTQAGEVAAAIAPRPGRVTWWPTARTSSARPSTGCCPRAGTSR